jgi:hypothetical protein
MKRTTALYFAATAVAVSLAACSGSSQSPTSPSSVDGTDTAANPDGSTLKVTAPALVTPIDGVKIDTRRPTFAWANAAGRFSATALAYRLELFDAAGNFIDARTVPGTENVTSFVADVDLGYATDFHWRVRAELDNQPGPYSAMGAFRTPDAPPPTAGPDPGPARPSTDGSVGGNRSMGVSEAFGIIVNVHNALRFNLGSGSSRDARVQFLWAAVAAIHYGHPRFNPQGGDPGWCVKDGGGGRPPSDDVLVRCGSREAWDLVGGAGANGYRFHLDFIGRLDGRQNVYPPPRSSLGRLGN